MIRRPLPLILLSALLLGLSACRKAEMPPAIDLSPFHAQKVSLVNSIPLYVASHEKFTQSFVLTMRLTIPRQVLLAHYDIGLPRLMEYCLVSQKKRAEKKQILEVEYRYGAKVASGHDSSHVYLSVQAPWEQVLPVMQWYEDMLKDISDIDSSEIQEQLDYMYDELDSSEALYVKAAVKAYQREACLPGGSPASLKSAPVSSLRESISSLFSAASLDFYISGNIDTPALVPLANISLGKIPADPAAPIPLKSDYQSESESGYIKSKAIFLNPREKPADRIYIYRVNDSFTARALILFSSRLTQLSPMFLAADDNYVFMLHTMKAAAWAELPAAVSEEEFNQVKNEIHEIQQQIFADPLSHGEIFFRDIKGGREGFYEFLRRLDYSDFRKLGRRLELQETGFEVTDTSVSMETVRPIFPALSAVGGIPVIETDSENCSVLFFLPEGLFYNRYFLYFTDNLAYYLNKKGLDSIDISFDQGRLKLRTDEDELSRLCSALRDFPSRPTNSLPAYLDGHHMSAAFNKYFDNYCLEPDTFIDYGMRRLAAVQTDSSRMPFDVRKYMLIISYVLDSSHCLVHVPELSTFTPRMAARLTEIERSDYRRDFFAEKEMLNLEDRKPQNNSEIIFMLEMDPHLNEQFPFPGVVLANLFSAGGICSEYKQARNVKGTLNQGYFKFREVSKDLVYHNDRFYYLVSMKLSDKYQKKSTIRKVRDILLSRIKELQRVIQHDDEIRRTKVHAISDFSINYPPQEIMTYYALNRIPLDNYGYNLNLIKVFSKGEFIKTASRYFNEHTCFFISDPSLNMPFAMEY